jgi:hypothetical protein
MERLDFHSNHSISRLPDLRPCQADDRLRSETCKRRGGWIEPERARSARYCSSCAPIVRREQSKLGKRQLRRNPRWRANQQKYKKQRREEHTAYMREWRESRRAARAATRAEGQRRAA